MPERNEHTEILRAGTPLTVGAVILLPIERVVTCSDQGNTGAWFSIAKEPYAVVVRDTEGLRAFDADANGISIEPLRGKIPELDALLESM